MLDVPGYGLFFAWSYMLDVPGYGLLLSWSLLSWSYMLDVPGCGLFLSWSYIWSVISFSIPGVFAGATCPRQNGSAHTAVPARPRPKEATPTKLADGWGSKGEPLCPGAYTVRDICRATLSWNIWRTETFVEPRHFPTPLCPGTYGEPRHFVGPPRLGM